jgi:hypothetical protein
MTQRHAIKKTLYAYAKTENVPTNTLTACWKGGTISKSSMRRITESGLGSGKNEVSWTDRSDMKIRQRTREAVSLILIQAQKEIRLQLSEFRGEVTRPIMSISRLSSRGTVEISR